MNQSINTDSKNDKEPQQKYRIGTVSIKILGGGLKPVLQAPNLALSFYHGYSIMNARSLQKLSMKLNNTNCTWICPKCEFFNFSDSFFGEQVNLETENRFDFISVFELTAYLKFAKLQHVSSGFRCRLNTGSLMRLY